MPLDYDTIAAARERLTTHLGRDSLEGLTLHDLNELLFQEAPDEIRLDALTYLHRLREDLDDTERGLIEALRDTEERVPTSWTRIGRALGMTRQGAEGRYLRLLSIGKRAVAQGRERLARQSKIATELRRRARARWGRYAVAERSWVVRLRARTHDGEEAEVFTRGVAGRLPRLDTWRTDSLGFVGDDQIEVLQVLHETTPWPEVEAPEGLAGLPGDR